MRKPMEFWTKEECRKLSLKCESRSDFRDKYNTPYRISSKNGWLDEICSHMKNNNNK